MGQALPWTSSCAMPWLGSRDITKESFYHGRVMDGIAGERITAHTKG